MSETRDVAPAPRDPDIPTDSELAFRMGLSIGRIEGLLDGMVSRLDRRAAEITQAFDARIAADAERDDPARTE